MDYTADRAFAITACLVLFGAVFCAHGQGQKKDSTSLSNKTIRLEEVKVNSEKEKASMVRLNTVQGFGIYESKKNEVIVLEHLTGNLATNNPRQIYAKVPGLNIWENDGAGLQLSIGARGLDPNRTVNFNVRQNGYDISADALGYPESYYTPPAEALETIEIVRGAASLQYGTQFGGLVNFKLKQGPKDKKLEYEGHHSYGSYQFFNTYNAVGGQVGNINYYTFVQYKQGESWRPNSGFRANTIYAHIDWQITPKLKVTGEHTFMHYLAQQPGGLTDQLFDENPQQSIRNRNWFQVNWYLTALNIDWVLSPKFKINMRNFNLLGGRDALGALESINRLDGGDRNLLTDKFRNFGNETRLLYHYQLPFGQSNVFLFGMRHYLGLTKRQQGSASDADDADFRVLNEGQSESSNFSLPNQNHSFFIENVTVLNQKWSVTQGVRYEYINTKSEGYFFKSIFKKDPVTSVGVEDYVRQDEQKSLPRSFVFFGLGASFRPTKNMELYGNFSQNYKSINFNDIRVINPNFVVDKNIKDETGYNIDLGVRSGSRVLTYDVSFFMLMYTDRIGSSLKRDPDTFRVYRLRSNIANSEHYGLESFVECHLHELLAPTSEGKWALDVFSNVSLTKARYYGDKNGLVNGNIVENTPFLNLKFGLNASYQQFDFSFQTGYVSAQYTDATNALTSTTAVEGLIPEYYVSDASATYTYKQNYVFGVSLNNVANHAYFTRRAAGYPGPGIIPSDGRTATFTFSLKI